MKKFVQSIVLIILLFSSFITPVHADMGPKPSVTISFEGIDEEYYVTLLSDKAQYGPHRKQNEFDGGALNKSIWEAFNNYEDEYYFIGYFEECTNTHEFHWGYYAPESFKVLIYFPESNTFIKSDIIEKYAYDSYYNVEFNNNNMNIEMEISNNIIKVLNSFIARFIITIAFELLIAYIFSLTNKKNIQVFIIVNLITQIFLNVGLNLNGIFWNYIFLEHIIIIFEAIAYKRFIKDVKNIKIWGYSISANLISLILGTMLAISLGIY